MKNPFFVTIPHSGEQIPSEADWLLKYEEPKQMRDVDRFVDVLYAPALNDLDIPNIVASTHRYVVDLNRVPEDIDKDSVREAEKPSGSHPTGFHWVVTTQGEKLMPQPISMQLHDQLTEKYWQPFHDQVKKKYADFGASVKQRVFQLDAHSMPSLGTDKHRDPGETRAEVVISDQSGTSCDSDYKDLVIAAYANAGFQVKTNWPYLGGRITETYGQPHLGQHCIQVELNRAMYMNEETKQLDAEKSKVVSQKISQALAEICSELPNL